jgi:hypothetical protein
MYNLFFCPAAAGAAVPDVLHVQGPVKQTCSSHSLVSLRAVPLQQQRQQQYNPKPTAC